MNADRTPMPANLAKPALPIDSEFDWRAAVVAAKENLWLFIVIPVLGTGIGWAYLNKQTPTYQSRATLEVEDKQKVVKVDEVSSTEKHDSVTMNTVAATVSSRTFLATVAAREKFQTTEGFFHNDKPGQVRKDSDVVNFLSHAVTAKVRDQTRLLDISANHTNPKIAQAVAQSVAEGIIRYGLAQRAEATSIANDFLKQEATRLQAELEKAELDLQKYRDENNAISLEDDQNLVVAQLKDLNTKLGTAKALRVQLETDFAALQSWENQPNAALTLASVSKHPLITSLTEALAAKKSEIAVISHRYLEKHPKRISLEAEKSNLELRLIKALPEVTKQLSMELENARTIEKKFSEALKEQETIALDLERLAVEYNMRKREVDTQKNLYETVLSRLKEVDITKGMDSNNLKIHEAAPLPGVPFSPKPKMVYSASIGGAFMLACALTALLHFLDRSVKTVDEAEKAFSLPVLSAIALDKKIGIGGIASQHDPQGMVAEAFRSLRAMAALLGREEERRISVVTSAVPNEGKTFCACNYAVSLAQQGLKTLLIDADLRKPSVSQLFYGESRKPGLTEYLIGKNHLGQIVHETEIPYLGIIPAGGRSLNPSELLSSQGLQTLICEAGKVFDRIIIDSSPVLAVSDTLLILPLVENVFQVVQWHKTPIPLVKRSIALMRESGKAPSGIILNQMPHKSKSYYYYYSPGYYGAKADYEAV